MLEKPKNTALTLEFVTPPKMPVPFYPWHIDKDGYILNQDVWRGSIYRLLGFEYNKYPIVEDVKGEQYVHSVAVKSFIHADGRDNG